jgi:hypothetical protein
VRRLRQQDSRPSGDPPECTVQKTS